MSDIGSTAILKKMQKSFTNFAKTGKKKNLAKNSDQRHINLENKTFNKSESEEFPNFY